MKLLKKMNWDHTNYGYSITNVGRIDIPNRYGDLELDAVYGPLLYSDVNEKTVGVVTVAGKLTCTITYNEKHVSENDVAKIIDLSRQHLRQATG